jgi:alkanesulfonate monooxygenase SsuD/methylene tetrahydromethanopterin reductase-like flavin-dependent oxidoreductase (luciferase family)
MMGRMMGEYWLPVLGQVGFLPYLKHDPDVPDAAVTPAYLAEHNWLVGAPDTVAAQLRRMYDEVGGFGTLLLFCFDYCDEPEAWHTSMRLLAEEVMPQVADLTPREAVALT